MDTINRMSLEAKEIEHGSIDTEKSHSSIESGSRASKKMSKKASVELTTAMGATIEQEHESVMLGESKESEEDLKDILTSKVEELEKKLKQ